MRSYIEKDTDAGKCKRHAIYDEYDRYKKWKQENDKFDMNDIVLKLITNKFKNAGPNVNGGKRQGGWIQLFNSACENFC